MTTGKTGPIVQTIAGAQRGVWRETPNGQQIAQFLGVPYAEAPVGALQFAAPVPRRPWAGVRDATQFGPTAQVAPLSAGATIPEPSIRGDDVLNLNVSTPDVAGRAPVLVWIHGGAYTAGSPDSPWYDGTTFSTDGIVTVALGYRLGVPGWMHLQGAPDNRGALDWVAALAWVRDNIAAFGGDPDRVTITGQSAGGGAVLHLLTMPTARGLFARAMSISAAVDDESVDHARDVAQRLAAAAGVPPTAAAFAQFDRYQLHDIAVRFENPKWTSHLSLLPFADGAVIPQPVVAGVRAGIAAPVPLLIGAASQEFNDVTANLPPMAPALVETALQNLGVTPASTKQLLAQPSLSLAIGQTITDVVFRQLVVDVALAHAGAAPTWVYEFDWRSHCGGVRGGTAFHCLDLPFWWNHLGAERVAVATGPNPPQRLATTMHDAMAGFIKGGSPGWASSSSIEVNAHVWDDPPTARRGFQDVIDRPSA